MKKVYCSACGAPTEYSIDKPKFCCSCGGGLGLYATSAVPKPKIRVLPTPVEDEGAEEENSDDFLGSIQGLDVELQIEPVQGQTIGQLARGVKVEGGGRPKDKRSAKKILKEFFDEARNKPEGSEPEEIS